MEGKVPYAYGSGRKDSRVGSIAGLAQVESGGLSKAKAKPLIIQKTMKRNNLIRKL